LKEIRVGIVTALRETAESLQMQIAQTGMAALVVQSEEPCSTALASSTRRIVDANPDIVIVEIRDSSSGLQTLQVLQAALPHSRLLITSNVTDAPLIIEAMRSGAREYLANPVSQATLLEAFHRYLVERNRTSTLTAAKRGKLFCITSAKHGSGATTLAVNLAGIIAAQSKRSTALLDLDRPVGDAAAYLNIKPAFTVSEALAAGPRLDSVLLESYMQKTNGFCLLAGFREYASNTAITAERLEQLLEVSQNTFAHTIVDLPPTMTEDQVQVIARNSQSIVIVLTPELPAIWRTERLLTYLAKLESTDKVRVILNRSSSSDEISNMDIERLLRIGIHWRLPNDYRACIKAINSGCMLDPKGSKHLYRAMNALAIELAGLPVAERRPGLFDLFLKASSIRRSTIA
jgi:pilus assembly protein CpaE